MKRKIIKKLARNKSRVKNKRKPKKISKNKRKPNKISKKISKNKRKHKKVSKNKRKPKKITKNRIKVENSKININFTKLQNLKYKNKSDVIDPDLVKTEKDFIDFLNKLYEEKVKDDNEEVEPYSSGNYGWENNTVSGFLLAMISGYEDRIEDNDNFDNVWTKIANIIYYGKIYE